MQITALSQQVSRRSNLKQGWKFCRRKYSLIRRLKKHRLCPCQTLEQLVDTVWTSCCLRSYFIQLLKSIDRADRCVSCSGLWRWSELDHIRAVKELELFVFSQLIEPCKRSKSSLLRCCIFPLAKYLVVVIKLIPGIVSWLCLVIDVTTNIVPAWSYLLHFSNSLPVFGVDSSDVQGAQEASQKPFSLLLIIFTFGALLRANMLCELHLHNARGLNLRGNS